MTDTLARIIPDLDEVTYHAHPALSSTGARKLLESPATFRWYQDHPEPPKKEFDVGTAVHAKVLGIGAPIAVIPEGILASNGAISTKEAKEFVTESRAKGLVPLKQAIADEINAMTEAVLSHRSARIILEQAGIPEASVFATDTETGVDVRARFDFLPSADAAYPWAVDLKTSAGTASKTGFAKSAADRKYNVQQGHYLDTLALATGEHRQFVFIVVEKSAPYLVGVHQLDKEFADMGAVEARVARAIYRECADADHWPGYPEDIQLTPAPMWAIYDHQDRFA